MVDAKSVASSGCANCLLSQIPCTLRTPSRTSKWQTFCVVCFLGSQRSTAKSDQTRVTRSEPRVARVVCVQIACDQHTRKAQQLRVCQLSRVNRCGGV